ncbi:MAG: helix-turn-helix domain-containing protein [Lachnospiraceae bacterium]|nr:helix-turn-helix domain-containing protein [Lachnospiraceae bacterium]
MIDYSPLWETMQKKNISQYYLLKHGIDNKTLDSLKKGKNITLLTLEKICVLLECTPNEVISFK